MAKPVRVRRMVLAASESLACRERAGRSTDRTCSHEPRRLTHYQPGRVGFAWRPPSLTACGQSHAAFDRRCIPAETLRFASLIVALRSKYTRYSSLARLVSRAPHRSRRSHHFIHRLLTACGETQAAQFSRWGLERRCIPAKQPVMKPARPSSPGGGSAGDPSRLTAPLRAAHRCVSVQIHQVFLPHAPCQPGASPASALTRVPPPAVHRVASRRSSLRFGRNTPGPVLPVGAPPSRALSAGPPPGELAPPGELGLTALGAHPGSTTGC